MGNDLASSIKSVTALQAQVLSGEAAAVYGPKIDRLGYEAAVISVQTGTPSGSPSNVGVVVKMQSMSGEVDWADVTSQTTTISGEALPHQHEIDYDLKSSERYIRAVATPHFTGGSAPKIELAATCVLGEPRVMPV
jgi:hypothetical protein